MLNITLRVILIVGSLLTLIFMLNRIRVSRMQIKDSIFWILFSLILFIFAVFPQIAGWASSLFGIQSPINFVLLFIIFILVVQLFYCNMRLSNMDAKINQLAQRVSINEKNSEENKSKDDLK